MWEQAKVKAGHIVQLQSYIIKAQQSDMIGQQQTDSRAMPKTHMLVRLSRIDRVHTQRS